MNPAQYKEAMRRRSAKREAEHNMLLARADSASLAMSSDGATATASQQSFAVTYPPHANANALLRGTSLLAGFEQEQHETSGVTSAASVDSSAGGGICQVQAAGDRGLRLTQVRDGNVGRQERVDG